MGRRLRTSTPTVIQTLLTPLSDTFRIEASDVTEQWYYVNTSDYKPNRRTTPLVLTPTLTAIDIDTRREYTPEWYQVNWYYFDQRDTADHSDDALWPGRGWVRIPAEPVQMAGSDYFYQAHDPSNPRYQNPRRQLRVMKNVPPATSGGQSGQPLCCVGVYVDPRDAGTLVRVKEVLTLVTNQDSTMEHLVLTIDAPTKTLYNPLTADGSLYEFRAHVYDSTGTERTSEYYFHWNNIDGDGIEDFWCYKQATQEITEDGVTRTVGQGTDVIVLDAMFTEHVDLQVTVSKTAQGAEVPGTVARCSLLWDTPKIDAATKCNMGNTVNEEVRDLEFDNIINHKAAGTLTPEAMQDHFLFHYTANVPQSGTGGVITHVQRDLGWGQSVKVSSEALKQTATHATPVHAECYLMGAYEPTLEEGSEYDYVTDDGEQVFDRL